MELTASDWCLLALAAGGVGVSKSGLSGVSMVHVLIFAFVFGARVSTGILLPLLIVGDLCAVWLLGAEVVWPQVRRLLPPALAGVLVGWWLMGWLDEQLFRWLTGNIILALSLLQLGRMWRPDWLSGLPESRWFVLVMGGLGGLTTMLANAAGPVVALYLLAIDLPKKRLVATSAWFFLLLNCSKVPLSAQLGLVTWQTLGLNLVLAPCVWLGLLAGRAIVRRIPQREFNSLLLAFTILAAIRLAGYW